MSRLKLLRKKICVVHGHVCNVPDGLHTLHAQKSRSARLGYAAKSVVQQYRMAHLAPGYPFKQADLYKSLKLYQRSIPKHPLLNVLRWKCKCCAVVRLAFAVSFLLQAERLRVRSAFWHLSAEHR